MSLKSPGMEKSDADIEVVGAVGEDGKTKTCGGGVQVTQTTEGVQPGKIRKRNRRGSKKNRVPRYKWRPYHKLSWEEKRKVNERDTIKAERRREKIREKGRPIAPYNTTQFLMDEHDTFEPDLRDFSVDHYSQSPVVNLSRSDGEEMESFTSEESFYEKDFSEMYETTHAETLHAMTKEELIENYLELERRIEFLEKEVRTKRSSCSISSESSMNSNPEQKREDEKNTENKEIKDAVDEKKKLQNENKKLKEELEALRHQKNVKS